MNKVVLITIVSIYSGVAFSADPPMITLFDFNQGSGQSWPEWSWHTDLNSYGATGWYLTGTDPNLGLGENNVRSNQHPMPWTMNKNDTSPNDTASIDTTMRAPSTSSGNSLRVYETESGSYNAGWWVYYGGKPLSERNITNNRTNRMSFYLRYDGVNGLPQDGNYDDLGQSFHIGTYLCWDSAQSGEGCPYEGPGNQHYYHYLALEPGAWVNVVLNQHPQHLRGEGAVDNNPVSTSGRNYFEQMHQFYMETRYRSGGAGDLASFNVDEIKYYSTLDSDVPNQNDESINSIWVGYWPDEDLWRIGWSDDSFGRSINDYTWSTFELRWSTAPITQANYSSANVVVPEPDSYGGVKYTGEENLIRKSSSWKTFVTTRFKLDDQIESQNRRIYFAVKDVSSAGNHIGTVYPYNRAQGDGHDAPTNNITLIDYNGLTTNAPLPPGNLQIN